MRRVQNADYVRKKVESVALSLGLQIIRFGVPCV
jgi:hypothetical protein